jgi:hypothetical protein
MQQVTYIIDIIRKSIRQFLVLSTKNPDHSGQNPAPVAGPGAMRHESASNLAIRGWQSGQWVGIGGEDLFHHKWEERVK